MKAGVAEPTVESVLDVRVRLGGRAVGATSEQVADLRRLLEVPSLWHEEGTPCDGYEAECWPGRKVDAAADTARHRPRERARRYAYVFISILRELGLTPTTLQVASAMKFDPDTLADTLRGYEFGRAAQRKLYLRALARVALERGYTSRSSSTGSPAGERRPAAATPCCTWAPTASLRTACLRRSV